MWDLVLSPDRTLELPMINTHSAFVTYQLVVVKITVRSIMKEHLLFSPDLHSEVTGE